MSNQSYDAEAVRALLADADCPAAFVERFMDCWAHGTPQEQLKLLACQRCRLLAGVHKEQKKLDCLDHLRYQLQKQQEQARYSKK